MILQNWWYTTLLGTEAPLQPLLKGDVRTDVVVVGAGMAGRAAALRLMKSDRQVTVLERTVCGGSTTGRSAGFLTPESELELLGKPLVFCINNAWAKCYQVDRGPKERRVA